MPSATRQSPGGCQCECSITFESRDPCSGNALVGGVDIKVYSEVSHLLLLSLTTNGSGVAETTGVPAGTYYVVASKSGMATGTARLNVTCGGTYSVPIGGVLQTVTVTSGCNWSLAGYTNILPGTKITVTKGSSWIELTADSAGKAYWYPSDGAGTYVLTFTHPSGRFVVATQNVTIANPCTAGSVSRQLVAAAGYSCCGTQLAKVRIPTVEPLAVVTSGGQILTRNPSLGCVYQGTWSVPVSRVGGVPQQHVCSPGVQYNIPPTPPHAGIVTVTATLTVSGTAVSASVSANMAGTSWRTVIDCSSVFGNTSPVAQSWWYCEAGDDGAFGVGWDSTSWTINSVSPFNATVYFDYPLTAFEFVDGDGKGPIPPIFESITVSE